MSDAEKNPLDEGHLGCKSYHSLVYVSIINLVHIQCIAE